MTTNKGALSLLTSYGDDSSDDDVPGCRVSTKRTLKECDEDGDNVKKIRLPVPNLTIRGCVYEEHSDNRHLHDGRIRSFPHERGNWATYAYIPYNLGVDLRKVVNELITMLPNVPLVLADRFHISLTKTIVLRHHWIEPFVQTIKERICSVKRFIILLNNLKVYCNEERTRTFLAIQAITGYDTLNSCVDILDQCLQEFRLAPFYKDRSFHMSIAWCVGDHEEQINSSLLILNHKLEEIVNKLDLQQLSIFVQCIYCKIGNKIFTFPLSL